MATTRDQLCTTPRDLLALGLAGAVLAAAGCGGGSDSSAPPAPAGYGHIRIAINWPQASDTVSSRIILTSMTAIDISITGAGMSPINDTLTPATPANTYPVPAGPSRTVTASATDPNTAFLYEDSVVVDVIAGHTVPIALDLNYHGDDLPALAEWVDTAGSYSQVHGVDSDDAYFKFDATTPNLYRIDLDVIAGTLETITLTGAASRSANWHPLMALADSTGTCYVRVQGTNLEFRLKVDHVQGMLIGFESRRDGNAEIYAMDPDGSNQRRLTDNPAHDLDPAWSPDGTRMAFTSQRDGNSEIYVMDADGSNQGRLTNNPAIDHWATWSPDGTRIAFASKRDGNFEIYTMNADGTNQVNLTNYPGADDAIPSWSPDGTKIAFQSSRDGSYYQVWVMNADGTNPVQLTSALEWSQTPTWSPDGAKIAFGSLRDGNPESEIYVMNADGSNQVNLTNVPTQQDLWPAWSPDGAKIAFGSYRDGNGEIYVMNPDGSAQTNVSNHPGLDDYPCWSPVMGP